MASNKNSTAVQPRSLPGARRINVKMVQNVLLIWCDSNIDKNNKDCQNTITQLRRAMNTINTFTDGEQCIQFLEEIEDEKVCMVISGTLGKHIVPRVQDMSQVDSVFIFCGNKHYHEQWSKDYSKVKGVYTDIKLICDALKHSAKDCEQNAISFSLVPTGNGAADDLSKKNLDQLDPMFMYTQIIKEILLVIEFKPKHILDFTNYCRELLEKDNKHELSNVKMLEREYRTKTPIWWYTLESFLYPMLNRALRLSDLDVIVQMGFFIKDLHEQIDDLHKQQFTGSAASEIFTVYRGQGMSKGDFDQVSKTKGGLIAFNNFLSTSKTEAISMGFARRAPLNAEMIGVLFVMKIDPRKSTAPFASVAGVGAYDNKEDEILFAMHTVFRIQEIERIEDDARLFRVTLALTSDNDKDLQVLTNRIRAETFPDKHGWERLGEVLVMKLNQPTKAEEIYQILLKEEPDEAKKGRLYNRLGLCKHDQVEYDEAIRLYKKSIAIYQENSPNNPDSAKPYTNIGLVYSKMGEYAKALSHHEKALTIRQQSLPSNHPDLAASHNNIGNVYSKMGEYAKALSYYEKALTIQQQSLPSNHPDLAASHNNIGNVYSKMGEYAKALSHHEKALTIRQQSLPSNHPDLAASHNNIGLVYSNMGEYAKALSHHEKALTIRQQSLPSNHPDLAASHNNIGNVYSDMGEYAKALSHHEKALTIQQQSLPSNHPNLAKSYICIGLVYSDMGEYAKALSYYEKVLTIQQQSLPSNHPDLAASHNNIGNVYSDMDEYAKALSHHEKALTIRQQSLPSNHPDLASSYANIGNVYRNMGEYAKALSYYEKALTIQQQSLPSNHPNLAKSYICIGLVYSDMGEYAKALSHHEKALTIQQQSLPSNHPNLAKSYICIGLVYSDMGEYAKALSYYEKVLTIQQQSLPSNHPDLAASHNNIGNVYRNMEDYSKAYSYYEKAVKIGEQSLLVNHPHLQVYRNNLETVKNHL